MPAISVIMPVYNSERYLEAAVSSVLNQTLRDFELILVDDGSSDGSASLCDAFAKADGRVVVLHQRNTGICGARNRGMQAAKGEYLVFSDHDDELLPNLLADNLLLAQKYHADVVKFGYQVNEVYEDGRSLRRQTAANELLAVSGGQLAGQFVNVKKSGFFNMVWSGIYKREFLERNSLRFDENIRFGYEDWVFNYQMYPLLTGLVLNPEVYYIHIMRYGVSTSSKFYPERLFGCLNAAKQELALYEKLNLTASLSGYWKETVVFYLIELISLLNLRSCPMSVAEKAAFFDQTKSDAVFSAVVSQSENEEHRLSKTKAMVASLYRKRHYRMLLALSAFYQRYLNYKKLRTNSTVNN